jgi:hypothetical protein
MAVKEIRIKPCFNIIVIAKLKTNFIYRLDINQEVDFVCFFRIRLNVSAVIPSIEAI